MPPSSSSRDRNVEDTYEAQNDQRLDDLHSKIRTLRGVRLKPPPQFRLVANSRLGHHRHPQGRRITEPAPRRIGALTPLCELLGPKSHLFPANQSNAFSSFTTSLSDSARRVNQTFGLGTRHPSASRQSCLPFQQVPERRNNTGYSFTP